MRGRRRLEDTAPMAGITPLTVGDEEGTLCDAIYSEDFRELLFELIAGRRKVHGKKGELVGVQGGLFRKLTQGRPKPFPSRVVTVEQSNSSLIFDDRFLLKIYRHLEEGMNPEPEILRFLTEKQRFFPCSGLGRGAGIPPSRQRAHGPRHPAGVRHGAWRCLEKLADLPVPICRAAPEHETAVAEATGTTADPSRCRRQRHSAEFADLVRGFHLEMVGLLGKRTAEMHLALAANDKDPAWRMEEFSSLYQRSVFQSMRSLVRRNFQLLAANRQSVPEDMLGEVDQMLASEKDVIACLHQITGRRIAAMKCRTHGDFHLGQALFTGKDFVFIDFEGEPARTLSERRLKRSPLRDVAGMIRSFHYAAIITLFHHGNSYPDDIPFLQPWLEAWYVYVSGMYIKAYLEAMGDSRLVPANRGDLATLLRCFLLEKAVYELGYEVNNRPEWISIPLKGIRIAMKECGKAKTP